MLLLNQKNSEKEGIFEFIVTNIPEFDDYADVLPLVQNAVQKARWRCDYTRRLTAINVRLDDPVRYIGDSMHRNVRTLLADIQNKRADLGAVGCVAGLHHFGFTANPLLCHLIGAY